MSIVQQYPFTTPGNYTVATGMGVTSGVATLLLVDASAQAYEQKFSTNSGYSFSTGSLKFVGETFFASYSTTIDAIRGPGGVTGTAIGTPTITGGKLDLSGLTLSYISYAMVDNAVLEDDFTVEFDFTPDYSGFPTLGAQYVISTGDTTTTNANYFALYHNTDGKWTTKLFQSSGNLAAGSTPNFGVWTATSGTPVRVSYNVSGSNNTVELFLDGASHGSALTYTSPRTATEGFFFVGTDRGKSMKADFLLQNLTLFNNTQRSAAYTVSSAVNIGYFEQIDQNPGGTASYLETVLSLPTFTYGGLGDLQIYESFTTTQTSVPQFVMNDLYWDGAAWSTSLGTEATSNVVADVLANIATLPATSTLDIDVVFTASATQQKIDEIDVTFTGQLYPTTDPSGSCNATFNADGLDQFLATIVASGSDAVKFILKVDSQKRYWNGSAWANSDGTYSQANLAADIETNKASLGISAGATIQVFFFLHSADGTTTPTLSLIDILYDFFNLGTTPTKCTVSGQVKDNSGTGILGATVEVTGDDYYYGTALISRNATATTDTNGSWEMVVVETATDSKVVNFRTRYTETVNGTTVNKTKTDRNVTIPNQAIANLSDILNPI